MSKCYQPIKPLNLNNPPTDNLDNPMNENITDITPGKIAEIIMRGVEQTSISYQLEFCKYMKRAVNQMLEQNILNLENIKE